MLRIQRELEEEGIEPEGFYMVGPLFEAESLEDFNNHATVTFHLLI